MLKKLSPLKTRQGIIIITRKQSAQGLDIGYVREVVE